MPKTHCHSQGLPNHFDNVCVGKNLQPKRSEKRSARLFPAPGGPELDARLRSKTPGGVAVAKNATEFVAHILAQIFDAIGSSFRRVYPFQEGARSMPRCPDPLQIGLVETLQHFRLVMAV